jgi:3',5'-cyclic-AMP phosphodiesterase
MLMAQITDIHLGFEPDNPAEFNRKRLDQVLHRIAAFPRQPDVLFATGDLVDRGDVDSYRRLKSAFRACAMPVWPCLGNHDIRANFSAVFPEIPVADGFVQYVVDTDPLRFLILDTLEEGRHGGAFCETRAAWLKARLEEAPDRATVLVLHHPPIDTGIAWLTTKPGEPWVARLAEAIAGHAQIVGIISGHIHRSIVTNWEGRQLVVCSSTAPQIALELEPIDPAKTDNRPLIVADPAAFALHWWNGASLLTHFDTAEEHTVLARFDQATQPMVDHMVNEPRSA